VPFQETPKQNQQEHQLDHYAYEDVHLRLNENMHYYRNPQRNRVQDVDPGNASGQVVLMIKLILVEVKNVTKCMPEKHENPYHPQTHHPNLRVLRGRKQGINWEGKNLEKLNMDYGQQNVVYFEDSAAEAIDFVTEHILPFKLQAVLRQAFHFPGKSQPDAYFQIGKIEQ
jgi:hypothetical protein